MSRKTWSLLSLLILTASLLLIIGGVMLVDPFEIYHQATLFSPPITNSTQNYSNAGIAKSYDYDSVIIGSSMTENFTPSQLDRLLGGHYIKLPINGGSPFNNKQMMDLAFASQEIKTIFYGVDIESFTYFYKTPKCEMPDYLYDDDLFNDTAYWFNKSVLLKYIPACLKTLGQYDPSLRDTMYNWGDLYEYGPHAAMRATVITGDPVEQVGTDGSAVFSQQSKLNAEYNILPYVQGHPDTEFIFFFPPYSLVRWYDFYKDGSLDYHLTQKAALVKALLAYDNVRIYDFQAETDWILNLDNYIDASHYGPWINDAMVELIAQDERRVTSVDTVLKNNAVISNHVDYLVSCGAWPDDFSPAAY